MVQAAAQPLPWKFVAMQRADGKWCVFGRHDDTPEWYRLIAEFASKDRAEGYAGIENDIAYDGDVTSFDDIHPAPQTLPDAPQNSVTPERVTVRASIERREIEVTREPVALKIETAAEESGEGHVVISAADSDVVITAPAESFIAKKLAGVSLRRSPAAPENPGPRGLPEGEHGRRRGLILEAIKDHIKEQDEFPSQTDIAARSGVSQGSLATYLSQLEQQGELAKDHAGCRYLVSRPDLPAKPRYGEQAKAAAELRGAAAPRPQARQTSGIKVRPEVAAAVASFPPSKIRKEIDAADVGRLDHKMQRRCQGCSTLFTTDTIQQYLCERCDSAAVRRA